MPDQSSAATEHAILREITAPLERLPEDPLALVEADFPTAMRGYDRHSVDAYVETTRQLVAELHATRTPEAAVRRALERVGEQVAGILQRAHDTAEQITARSRSESEDRLEQARREAGRLIETAEDRVRELDADADRIWAERQRIVADAEDLSAQLGALAQDATSRFVEAEPRDDAGEAAPVGDATSELRGPVDGAPAGPADLGPAGPAGPMDGDREPPHTADDEEAEDYADPDATWPPTSDPYAPQDEEPQDEEPGDGVPRDDEPLDDEPGGRQPDPGIERTVAFTPLRLRERETGPDGDVEPDAADTSELGADRPPATETGREEDSTRIIPPASDAARRHESE